LSGWTTRTLASVTSRLFGGKNINQPFSLGRLAASARRVLIVPADGLAEALLLYPALSLLRVALPDARLICVVQEEQKEILTTDSIVDDLVELPRVHGTRGLWGYRTFVSEIRERMIEAVFYFDFRHDFYRLMLPILSGARLRVRLKGDIGHPLFNVEVIPGAGLTYVNDLNLCLVRFLSPDEYQARAWHLPEKEAKIAKEIVRFRKPNPTDLMIGVDLSFGKSGEKPPLDIEIRLARSFAALKPSRLTLLSDHEPAVSDEEIRRLGPYDWLDIPRKSFRDTLGILSQCDCLISANTNLFHFAVAMGVPAFALFSERDDRRWIPRKGRFRVVEQASWAATSPAKLAMKMRDFLPGTTRV
jgi:ADP-heptose:LPS heptosyltransferase